MRPTSFGSRFLTWMVLVGCLAGIPFFLGLSGLRQMGERHKENQLLQAFDRLEGRLDVVERCQDDGRYFRALLGRLFQRAERARDPIGYLRGALPRFAARFGPSLTFVAWNSRGEAEILPPEFRGFRYVLTQIWKGLRLIAETPDLAEKGDLSKVAEFSAAKFKQMKTLLGDLLVREHLTRPYARVPLSPLILASSEPNRSYLWFHIGKRVGVLCFLDAALVTGRVGLKRIVASLNRRRKDGPRLGLAFMALGNPPPLVGAVPDRNLLLRSLKEFRATCRSRFALPTGLVAFRVLDPRLVAFATLDSLQTGHPPGEDLAATWKQMYLGFILLLAAPVLVFTFGTGVLDRPWFLSIRWRLLGLLVLANGFPLCLLLFWGVDFLHQERVFQESQVTEAGERLLRSFDRGMVTAASRLEVRMQSLAAELQKDLANAPLSGAVMARCDQAMAGFGAESAFLLTPAGGRSNRPLASGGRFSPTGRYAEYLGLRILDFFNHELESRQRPIFEGAKFDLSVVKDDDFFETIESRMGRIMPWNLGFSTLHLLFEAVLDPRTGSAPAILVAVWKPGQLQERYVRSALLEASRNAVGWRVLARDENDHRVYPGGRGPSFQALFDQTAAHRGRGLQGRIRLRGRDYLTFGIPGKELSSFSLLGLYPLARIEGVMSATRRHLVLFGLMNLFLSLAVGLWLARGFLTPVRHLDSAARAIGARDFSFRLPPMPADEYGRLGQVFNQVLEGMGDLQVARVVQESLFPRRMIVTEGFRLFGKSLAMRELGGDYFDYFPVAGDRWGVVIGDVTGHGVPAALGMAIAKVGVKGSVAEQGRPSELLHRLDQLFGRVKGKRTWSMSLCYLVFDGGTGQGTIASAGHPGPIHVSPRSGTARYLSLTGSLLGYNLKRPYRETPLALEPGEALVLYSDGLFETPLRDGSPLGIPRWRDLVGQAYDPDPEVFFQKILAAHASLAGSQEAMDDITLVILVREAGR